MLSKVINMIDIKVTPEMIRHIIKEKDRLITTEQSEMFLNLFAKSIKASVPIAKFNKIVVKKNTLVTVY